MDHIPSFYDIKKEEVDINYQLLRLQRKINSEIHQPKDYYTKYYNILKSLIREETILFNIITEEIDNCQNSLLTLQIAISYKDQLQDIRYVPLLITFSPTNYAMEHPPSNVKVELDSDYEDWNSVEIINNNRVLKEWREGDRQFHCGLKPFINLLKDDFHKKCPIRKKGSLLIDAEEIKDYHEHQVEDGHNTVYIAKYKEISVIIKSIIITPGNQNGIKRELEVLSSIHHDNIVEFIGYFFYNNTINLVTKKAKYTLSEYLKKHPNLSLKEKGYILYSIAYAISFLQSKHIIHNDLKLTNILLDDRLVKICDFGCGFLWSDSLCVTDSLMDSGNAIHHSRLLKNASYDKQKLALEIEDVYAFGIIIMEVLLGENETDEYINNNRIFIESELQPHPALKEDPVLYSIVSDCLKENFTRPHIGDIAQRVNKWFNTLV